MGTICNNINEKLACFDFNAAQCFDSNKTQILRQEILADIVPRVRNVSLSKSLFHQCPTLQNHETGRCLKT